MKRLYAYRGFFFGIPVLFIWMFIAMMKPNTVLGGSISGSADVTYHKTTSTKDDDASSLTQGYNLNLNKSLTSTISLSGSVRMTVTDRDGEKDKRYSPQIFLNYTSPFPEYFTLSMGYNRSEEHIQSGSDLTRDAFNTTLSIPTIRRWLPSLSIFYNQQETKDDLAPHSVDSTTSSIGISSSYGLEFKDTPVSLQYSYTSSKTDDNVGDTNSDSQSHKGTINANRSFWNNRITVGGNFGLSRSENIQESFTGPRLFEETKQASKGLYAIIASPYTTGSLQDTPSLINNNKSTSAGINLNTNDQNIGLEFAETQKIHKIHLYTDSAPTSSLQWELFTSSDNITWTSQGSPTVAFGITFNGTFYNGFTFTFTEVEARYFKVVNTSSYPSALNVTEIEAIGYINQTLAETVETTATRDFGGLSLSFKATDRANISYSINYNHSDSTTSGTQSSGILSMGQSASFSYILFPKYLNLTTNYSTQGSKPSQGDKSGSSNYSLSFVTTPITTVKGNLTFGYSKATSARSTQSTSNNINTGISMELYKGVDLRLSTGLSGSEDKVNASTTDVYSISGRLKLVPWNPLQITLSTGHSSSSTKKAGVETKTSGDSLGTDIFYNPSRKIYITALFKIKPQSSQDYSFSWRPTQKVQIALSYSISNSDATSFSSSISWLPLSRLTMRTSYVLSRNEAGDKQGSFLLAVSIRL